MEVNFAHPISLEDLEQQFYVSRYKITEQFTKLVGYPPYKYLLHKRLQNAQYMLKKEKVLNKLQIYVVSQIILIFIEDSNQLMDVAQEIIINILMQVKLKMRFVLYV